MEIFVKKFGDVRKNYYFCIRRENSVKVLCRTTQKESFTLMSDNLIINVILWILYS